MNVRINDGVFKGPALKHLNGTTGKLEPVKKKDGGADGDFVRGAGGKTFQVNLKSGTGCVFLTEDQFTKVK